MLNIKVLVLAAGESVRLGSPKQLLRIGGETLLVRTLNRLVVFGARELFVVLGAKVSEVKDSIPDSFTNLIFNTNWGEGMGSSIACGVRHIVTNFPRTEAILITPCDLPFITTSDYLGLAKLLTSPTDIVATQAEGEFCPPVLFGRAYFEELSDLTGKQGAKLILKKHPQHVKFTVNERASLDVDTPEAAALYTD